MSFLLEGILAVTWQQLVMYVVGGSCSSGWPLRRALSPPCCLPMGFGAILVNLPYFGRDQPR